MTNAPGSRPFPPVAELRKAGMTVFSGNDNIRDSWWPYGDGDMLNRATTIGYRSGFYTDEELAAVFDVITDAGAKALKDTVSKRCEGRFCDAQGRACSSCRCESPARPLCLQGWQASGAQWPRAQIKEWVDVLLQTSCLFEMQA